MTTRTGPSGPSGPRAGGPDGGNLSGGWGALCGLLAALVAMGIAQFLAAISIPAASPVVAVGEAAIGSTPLWLKDWTVSTFGEDDKNVLVGGVLVVVLLYSLVLGALAARRLWLGYAGLIVFAALGLSAALTRPTASPAYALPTLGGAIVGAFALSRLITTARDAAGEAVLAYRMRAARTAELRRPITFGPAEESDGDSAGTDDNVNGDESAELGWLSATGDTDRPADPGRAPAGAGPGSGTDPDWEPEPFIASPLGQGLAGSTARRSFLTTAGWTVAAAAIGEYAGQAVTSRRNVPVAQYNIRFPKAAVPAPPLPKGINPVPGISTFITPNSQFYRVDTAIVVPQVAPTSWQLRIHGMVAREVVINFDELLRRPLIEDYITLCCVSNPVSGPYIGNAKWLGASYAALIREAGPLRGADQLLCTSSDGFTSGTPLAVVLEGGLDALIAVAMNGTALPAEHGFPARLVVPGLYGYVSACKWVVDIEVTTFASAVAYWAQNGWSQQAPIKTESRIDVPASGQQVKAGTVTVAGVAWAQHKGIEAVEVQVDNGPWQEATLAPVPDLDCWRQWTYEWRGARPGPHLIQARATDKTGYTQTAVQEPVAPNGATGYPQNTVTVYQ